MRAEREERMSINTKRWLVGIGQTYKAVWVDAAARRHGDQGFIEIMLPFVHVILWFY
jgi:hypothetical protein